MIVVFADEYVPEITPKNFTIVDLNTMQMDTSNPLSGASMSRKRSASIVFPATSDVPQDVLDLVARGLEIDASGMVIVCPMRTYVEGGVRHMREVMYGLATALAALHDLYLQNGVQWMPVPIEIRVPGETGDRMD